MKFYLTLIGMLFMAHIGWASFPVKMVSDYGPVFERVSQQVDTGKEKRADSGWARFVKRKQEQERKGNVSVVSVVLGAGCFILGNVMLMGMVTGGWGLLAALGIVTGLCTLADLLLGLIPIWNKHKRLLHLVAGILLIAAKLLGSLVLSFLVAALE